MSKTMLFTVFFMLAILILFATIKMKSKKCGSFWGSAPPKSCTGEYSTCTTALGRTAWTILCSFPFRCKFPAATARNTAFCHTHFGYILSGNVCIGNLPETCRVGTTPARHFCFSLPPQGEPGSPRLPWGFGGKTILP